MFRVPVTTSKTSITQIIFRRARALSSGRDEAAESCPIHCATMAKRKRDEAAIRSDSNPRKAPKPTDEPAKAVSDDEIAIQIVTGSYERVLHGITATIPRTALSESSDKQDAVQFADAFLFNAHASAIRSLALSPISDDAAQSQNVILASGGTDERINLYTLSTSPTPTDDKCPSVPTLTGNKILENPRNRELGSLLHHSSTITALYFPTRSKLLAAAEDNTISVTRLKDLTVVSTIKAPRPKAQGRPSGDTAPVGGAPSGVNDFAVHPSMKLMLSVGRGEKCMRLWNLVTGKKAGVLNFGREVLEVVKEGKWGSGEGRKIVWDSTGEEFAVSFDRGVVVFGVVSLILPSYRPQTDINLGFCAQMSYPSVSIDKGPSDPLYPGQQQGRQTRKRIACRVHRGWPHPVLLYWRRVIARD